MVKWRYLLPLGLFIVLVVFLSIGLKLNPREVPSPLINKAAPTFSLPQLFKVEEKFSPADLKGKVWLLNVWASWCVSCRAEHPVLNELSKTGEVIIVGLNYKDENTSAMAWLKRFGDPYKTSVIDSDGRIGIDWGVYGVPETFVIDKKGLIRLKHTGPVNRQDVEQTILPLVRQLEQETV